MIWILLISILSAILYRMGGTNLGTKWRDLGVPFFAIVILLILNPVFDWKHLLGLFLSFGSCFASMTSYFKKKGTDAQWYNWLFVGIAFSFALLPYAILTGMWIPFILRGIILTPLIIGWCQWIGLDWLEEGGRGFLFCITLLLFKG